MLRNPLRGRLALPAAALLSLAVVPAAHAVSPVVTIKASAKVAKFKARGVAAGLFPKLNIDTSFSTDTPGAPLFTVQRTVILFPDRAGTNGAHFPTCNAKQINAHGIVRCPKGSKIGSGALKAIVQPMGVAAKGTVTMFNSHQGKDITFHIFTTQPARISQAFDAPLVMTPNGEQLTMDVPPSLQEVLPGIFVGLQDFHVTTGSAIVRHGRMLSYFKAHSCPSWNVHGDFTFEDSSGQQATASADAPVRCGF